MDEQSERDANRRTVAALEAAGDRLTKPRLVTHWITFGSVFERASFLEEVVAIGFVLAVTDDDSDATLDLSIARIDRVDLESIDRVVLELVRIAECHSADYDGWETSVETD